jgi:adenosylcobinamide-GDP ribazoletransferase
LLGLLAALVFALVGLLLRANPAGPAVAAVASLFAVLVLTGAAQETAVFRLAERMEARAARGGSGHGVIALVLLLAGRIVAVAALGAVSEPAVLAALFAAPVLARFAPLPAAHWSGHGIDGASVWVAALWCVVPLLLMVLAEGPAFLLLALLGAAAGWVAMLRFLRRHPGNFDEERTAALQQACELAFYLGAVIGA